jgi:hypothetical protein
VEIASKSQLSDSDDSTESSTSKQLDVDSDCESDKEDGQSDIGSEDMIDADSDKSVDDESEIEEDSHHQSAFEASDVIIEEFDTSTLRSQSSSRAEAKVFPQFKGQHGQERGPINIPKGTDTPLQFLQLFWDDEVVMATFVESTNSNGRHTFGEQWKDVDVDELWRFFAIIMFSGLNKVPQRRFMWGTASDKFSSNFVKSLMSCKRFEEILRCLHWEDSSMYTDEEIKELNKDDCFWRIVELEELLAERFQFYYECGQYIDGDEQGIPAKCYHSAIQYNGDKPCEYAAHISYN